MGEPCRMCLRTGRCVYCKNDALRTELAEAELQREKATARKENEVQLLILAIDVLVKDKEFLKGRITEAERIRDLALEVASKECARCDTCNAPATKRSGQGTFCDDDAPAETPDLWSDGDPIRELVKGGFLK